jgi:hypothetical protein
MEALRFLPDGYLLPGRPLPQEGSPLLPAGAPAAGFDRALAAELAARLVSPPLEASALPLPPSWETLFSPHLRAGRPLVEAAGPFAGRGLFTTSDPAQAIRPGVDWVAVRPERLSDDLVSRLRAAGIRLVVWEASASQAGLEAVRRYRADGYIAQAEGPGELEAALRLGPSLDVPKALVTNNFMSRWPSGWIAMPEAYSGQNPLATVERVVADARIRGAEVVIPVLGLFTENGRGPASLEEAGRDLARITVPGLAVFTVETAGEELRLLLGPPPPLPAPQGPAPPPAATPAPSPSPLPAPPRSTPSEAAPPARPAQEDEVGAPRRQGAPDPAQLARLLAAGAAADLRALGPLPAPVEAPAPAQEDGEEDELEGAPAPVEEESAALAAAEPPPAERDVTTPLDPGEQPQG